jgi:hypothetical protein
MTADLKTVLRADFYSFLQKAHGGSLDDAYIAYLAHELARVARRETKRLIVNLPPRHLKTFASSICLPAFILGNDPSAKIMIIAYGENLAVEIADRIRGTFRAAARVAADPGFEASVPVAGSANSCRSSASSVGVRILASRVTSTEIARRLPPIA